MLIHWARCFSFFAWPTICSACTRRAASSKVGQATFARRAAIVEAAPGKGYTLYFDFDSARIRPAGTRTIDTVIGTLDGRAGPAVTLGGHADRAGTEAYNLDLSLRRARSVHDALVRRGIPPPRVTIQAFGEMRPKVPTQDGVREPGNRRVEILLNAR